MWTTLHWGGGTLRHSNLWSRPQVHPLTNFLILRLYTLEVKGGPPSQSPNSWLPRERQSEGHVSGRAEPTAVQGVPGWPRPRAASQLAFQGGRSSWGCYLGARLQLTLPNVVVQKGVQEGARQRSRKGPGTVRGQTHTEALGYSKDAGDKRRCVDDAQTHRHPSDRQMDVSPSTAQLGSSGFYFIRRGDIFGGLLSSFTGKDTEDVRTLLAANSRKPILKWCKGWTAS